MTDKRIKAAASRLACVALGHHFLTRELAKSVLAAADAVDTEKQELLEALRFYADPLHYVGKLIPNGMKWEIVIDGGDRAREVLAKHGG